MVEVLADEEKLQASGEHATLILMAIEKVREKMRNRPKVKATSKFMEPVEIYGNKLGVAWKAVDTHTIEVVSIQRLQKKKRGR